MRKRDFLKRLLMGTGIAAATGIPIAPKTEKPEVVSLSGPLQCGTCGDMLYYQTKSYEAVEFGYVEATCFRCQKTWRLPIKGLPAERIPNAAV